MLTSRHWLSMREIFGDPDLGLPPSSSSEADEHYARGIALMKEGNAPEAKREFERADELGHAGAPRELANWPAARGEIDLSGEWGDLLARARERGDGRAASLIGRALLDDSEQGLDHLRFADQSGDPGGSRELGMVLMTHGDLREAEAAFERADERGGASGSLALGLFLRDKRNDLLRAEAAFQRAEQRGHPKGSLNLLALYLARGDDAAADRARERVLELAARHRTLFDEMQGPDFVEFVRGRERTPASATASSGSGCAIASIAAFAAGVTGLILAII